MQSVSRRKILECMTWAGTGVLWTVAGGVPRSMGIIGEAAAAEPSGLTFLQISDSHVGFDKPANPNAIGTLEEAINKIKTLPVKPAFVIHTGDVTHLSKPSEFDDADRIIAQSRLDVHYVRGEHDFLDDDLKLYRETVRGIRSRHALCGAQPELMAAGPRPLAASLRSSPSSTPAAKRGSHQNVKHALGCGPYAARAHRARQLAVVQTL
jgi:hypothetical protein